MRKRRRRRVRAFFLNPATPPYLSLLVAGGESDSGVRREIVNQ